MTSLDPLANKPLHIGGVDVIRTSWEESFDLAFAWLQERPARVGWIYANCVNILKKDEVYQQAGEGFEFLFNDGAGIEIAARLLKTPVVENLSGTDWIPDFVSRLPAHPELNQVFLLGTTPQRIAMASRRFSGRWPEVRLAGYHHGYFDDPAAVVEAIRECGARTLIVGLGVPKQEIFIGEHWGALTDAGVKVAIAGGAILDHISGAISRSPAWIRRVRLEWLYRLVTEPSRLWRRYLLGNVLFFWNLQKELRSNRG